MSSRARGALRRMLVAVAGLSLVALPLAPSTGAAGSAAARSPRMPAARSAAFFDARAGGGAVAAPARVLRARADLARTLGPLGVVQTDRVTGTLRFVGRLDGFLTGPSVRPARRVALDFVRSRLAAFGLSRPDLATFDLRRDYVDVIGTHHLSWVQRADGLTVFGSGLSASVTADGRLVNVTGSPVHSLEAPSAHVRIDRDAAVVAARAAAGGSTARQSADTAERVLFPTARGARRAWRTVTRISDTETDLSIVDAETGEVLWRANLTVADSNGTGQAVEYYPGGDVPLGGGTAHQVTFPVADGTALSGNNAHVYSDVNDDDAAQPRDEVPAASGLDWNYPPVIDTTTTAQNCSTHFFCTWDATTPRQWRTDRRFFGVQLYHYLNVFHDHLLASPIGFTEAAGNFQVTNASGQGEGGDPVQGQFIDGANLDNGFPDANHLNNANMSTQADGEPPVMQMYLQTAAPGLPNVPSGDSGTEAETVYHEYTHGLSNRLVTQPDGTPALNTPQSGAMGEAWSDWYAVDFTDNQGFFPDGPADGDAIIFRYSAGDEVAFRTEAIDCPVNSTAANCGGTPGSGPGGYTYGDFGTIVGGPEVHADGEIWLQALWDVRTALGSDVSESIITRGMELSAPDPSYLDMRNAIIQADLTAFGGSHVDQLWQIFAARGMGYFAASLDGGDTEPVEDFSVPPDCAVDPCGSISGTVTDSESGAPIEGLEVFVAGQHHSGFPADLADTSDATGAFSITDVPFHDYPEVVATGAGYEPFRVPVTVDGDERLDVELVRDWAATVGGARVLSFTPPDYSPFCGVGAEGAFDLSLGSGWASDSPRNDDSGVTGARSAVVRLPRMVDVTTFGVASGGTCGDGPDAGVKRFQIQTRGRHGPWVTAVRGRSRANGVLRTFTPTQGTANVRMIRFVMLSNHGNPDFMDVLEVTVRGTT